MFACTLPILFRAQRTPQQTAFNAHTSLTSCLTVAALQVVVQRLDCDRGKVRLSIFLGMGISLAMFLLWDGAILASSTSEVGASDPLSGLRAASPIAGPLINVFTFLLVSSSFVCFVLSVTVSLSGAVT